MFRWEQGKRFPIEIIIYYLHVIRKTIITKHIMDEFELVKTIICQ